MWKHGELVLRNLPIWNGSLIRFPMDDGGEEEEEEEENHCTQPLPICVQEGGYNARGPLSREEVFELEPSALNIIVDDDDEESDDSMPDQQSIVSRIDDEDCDGNENEQKENQLGDSN